MKSDGRISSEIIIDGPPEAVWRIIIDFDRYPLWNSFTPRITAASRDFYAGAEFDLDCRMTDRELLVDEHEMILEIDPEKFAFCMGTSRTKGRPGIRSYRWQICEPLAGNRTRLVNYERFEGPLAPLVRLLYRKKLTRAFERYCLDLKKFVETDRPNN